MYFCCRHFPVSNLATCAQTVRSKRSIVEALVYCIKMNSLKLRFKQQPAARHSLNNLLIVKSLKGLTSDQKDGASEKSGLRLYLFEMQMCRAVFLFKMAISKSKM